MPCRRRGSAARLLQRTNGLSGAVAHSALTCQGACPPTFEHTSWVVLGTTYQIPIAAPLVRTFDDPLDG